MIKIESSHTPAVAVAMAVAQFLRDDGFAEMEYATDLDDPLARDGEYKLQRLR